MNRRSFLKTSVVGAGIVAGLRTLDLPAYAQDGEPSRRSPPNRSSCPA